MKIPVNYEESVSPVAIYIDGVCTHNFSEYETVEGYRGGVSTELYCSTCGAWYNDLDDKWVL